jgi:beta-glucosidase
VINVRAWGEDPASAGALAAAFVRGAQAEGVLACAKHFPGHGDTSSDSHLTLPLLAHSRERLAAIELPPFEQAIAAGVASVMTAHLMLPALDPERPATLSKPVLTELLREELGFGGLVVTDALVMDAIAGHYGAGEAAVLALEAGADLVLMPADAQTAIKAIETAVNCGRLSVEKLEQSARRREKALQSTAASDMAASAEQAAQPDRALELELIQTSLRWNTPNKVPDRSKQVHPGVNLIRCENIFKSPFLGDNAPALAVPESLGYQTLILESHSLSAWSDDPKHPLSLARLPRGPVFLQLFTRGNPFLGNSTTEEIWFQAIRQLHNAHRLAGVIIYGSPYLWDRLQPTLNADAGLPAAYSPGQMPMAQTEALKKLGLINDFTANNFTT